MVTKHRSPVCVYNSQENPAKFPVALVSMPFVPIDTPSIQLGLLKSIASSAGFPVTNYHLSLDFARQIGLDQYSVLANHRGRLFGDWLFSAAAFGGRVPSRNSSFLEDFRDEIGKRFPELGNCPVHLLRILREKEVPKYLKRLVDCIPWNRFSVVGFTSTFQQNIASFALATMIKLRYPTISIVFGGANFDGEMGTELVRTMDCIDYAISGEADAAFPEFLFALLEGRDPAEVPGVLCRRRGVVLEGPAREQLRGLDDLPVPDYDEYFERAEFLGLIKRGSRGQSSLPFESSRGCWWGQKHHCTFCGLNGSTMSFRAKSPERVSDELAELSLRYRTFRFQAVDNILPMKYLQELLPRLRDQGTSYTLFYETKANLKREHIALLRDAGVRSIQPGIESLSSHVLDLMRKGVTAIQNVNLLRWAAYYKVCVVWNLIWGFPGETEQDYCQQAKLIPRLVHLQPPLSTSRIWMERFSPIFFDREAFPARRVSAESSYAYVYPDFVDKERVAYFFDYEFEESLSDSVYEPVASQSQLWQQAWSRASRPQLTFLSSPDYLQIEDRRSCPHVSTYNLVGPIAKLYAGASNGPQGAATLKDKLSLDWSQSKIEAALDELCSQGLTMRDGDLFLSLAIPASADDTPRDTLEY